MDPVEVRHGFVFTLDDRFLKYEEQPISTLLKQIYSIMAALIRKRTQTING